MFTVRAVFTTCVFGDVVGSCNCAVSVKAGDAVFVINRCFGNTQKIKTKPTMWKNGQLMPGFNVYSMNNGQQFHVITPIGTKVVINLERTNQGQMVNFLNIFIIPSVLDWHNTEGLCGIRGETTTEPAGEQETGTYWQSAREDIIFYGVPKNPYTINTSFCYMSDVDQQCNCDSSNLFENCDLALGATDVTESIQTGPVSTTRRKRDVGDPFVGMNVDTTAVAVGGSFPTESGMTYEQANETCRNALTNNSFYDVCASIVKDIEAKIVNCLADIKMTGSLVFLDSAVRALMTECQLGASSLTNSTLINEIRDATCPSECSGHGSCSNGVCTCDDGFKAADCSIDVGEAPVVEQLADTTCESIDQTTCKSVTVYGQNFLSDATCHFEIVQMTGTGVDKTGSTTMTVPATLNAFDEVTCDLVGSLTLHSVLVSISNNGVATSEQHLYIAYNPDCFQCTWLSQAEGTCQKQQATCYIDGVCYKPLDQSVSEECFVCDPRSGQMVYNVSENCMPITTTDTPYHASQQEDNTIIIGTSVGVAVLLFIIIVIAVMVLMFKHMQRTHLASEKREHNSRGSRTSEEGNGFSYPAFANYGYQGYPGHGYPAMYMETPQDVFVNSIPKRHHSRHADPTRNIHDGRDIRQSQQDDYYENPYISYT